MPDLHKALIAVFPAGARHFLLLSIGGQARARDFAGRG
jgi:hypothetical protein